jgi:hypothetical protein
MATAASGVVVSLPGGSTSEAVSISVTRSNSKPAGYSSAFSLNAGSVQVVSFDDPGCEEGTHGGFSISFGATPWIVGTAVVDSVDTQISVNEVIRYTTTLRITELP